MGKTKFRYNPETLSYEKVSRSLSERIARGFLFIAPTIVLSLIFGFIIANRIDSPREKRLQKELTEVNQELENWKERLSLIEEVTQAMQKRDEDLYRAALGAKEFPKELRLMGIGGSDRYKHLKNKSNAALLIETGKKLDEIESRLHAQSVSFKELVELAKDNESRLANLPAIQPVRNKELRKMVSGFGWRIDPVYGTRKMHWGMDFTGNTGTEIFATGGGIVEEVKTSSWGYGREIVINHGHGLKSRYAHLSAFKVKEGDTVKRGDVIGLMGNTGKSTGTHLHYEVEKDGHKVNPINYMHADLTSEEYEEILKISNNALKSMD
jgi:murein DD-endopeptidase MepM/ murein hydrolase activator NlpD